MMANDLFEQRIKEPKPGTQHYLILQYLRTGNALTPLDALRIVGSMKLATRVSELNVMGCKIKSEWVNLPNGKKVKRYFL